mmetsp:Transcript_17275/g.60353  ORF Transcript_17275/g.60353 Transcript_17275/m.60353 type:complete len:232 (-) Transcript_17275:35-730(-)|eukprot:CAMPEP_0204202474 /NCGR_PEP_ID=MMETSP0361-20130328/68244_1 /ASSEMBLY_ACC=CAM_ASM_000343 /TAXON_ID=268821 /ORGANISM="Scrippsiella Hangoei, Strain SHTV-5" /LENGTH=231 /DNA_ID=CAMNT_0051165285 /DNA_START=49 /DNA_END=744 /DNA_ORIENTATION=-
MMQYYALDPVTSLRNDIDFLDFSVDPDAIRKWNTSLNSATNLLWYNMIGNVAFVGFAGAFPESVLAPHLDEACRWLGSVAPRPNWVFVVGHWNTGGGEFNPCPHMDTPSVYRRLLATPGCKEFGTRLKYQDGHEHCNHVQERVTPTGEAIGFMVGASGMGGCSQYGFEYLDSSGGELRVVYFELENASGTSRSDLVFDCIREHGLPSCTHLGSAWFQSSSADNDKISRDSI